MASKAAASARPKSIAPDMFEKLLGQLALALLTMLLVALNGASFPGRSGYIC